MLSDPRIIGPVLSMSLIACGGEIAPENTTQGEVPADPADPSNPEVLPTGLYDVKVIAASCNVNDAFQRDRAMLIVRQGTLANVPLPARRFDSGPPRTDWDLTNHATKKWSMKNEDLCPGGAVATSLQMSELTASSIRFVYREEPVDCFQPTCTVDF